VIVQCFNVVSLHDSFPAADCMDYVLLLFFIDFYFYYYSQTQ